MRGVEALPRDVEFKHFRQPDRHVVEHLRRGVIVAKELLVAFDCARTEFSAGLEVESELDVGAEHIHLGGFLRGPVVEIGEEDEPSHRIEFFGGLAAIGAEMLSEMGNGKEVEDGMAKEALPTLFNGLASDWGEESQKGVEQAFLRGIDDVSHSERNSFCR